MLRRLSVRGFKSLADVTVSFPRLTVLFGPNAAGKSNLLDAIQALSRIATCRMLSDALSEPIRGNPVEAFSFPAGGLPALLASEAPSFVIESDLEVEKEPSRYRYRVEVGIQPASGALSVRDEFLCALSAGDQPKGTPSIQRVEKELRIRRKSKPGHPRQESVGLPHALISDARLGGIEYRAIERCREELEGWRVYYLDPRVAMRSVRTPADVRDIGFLGEDIAPFLYRLRAEKPKHFEQARRTLRSLIPTVDDLVVDLDKRRGTLDILVRQAGTEFSSRIISEGTLRVLALCAIAVNPWSGSLVAFEEPENGVHPRRLELIAKLLVSLSVDGGRQVVVTTHSPIFCEAVLREAGSHPNNIVVLNVKRGRSGTEVQAFDVTGPLWNRAEIEKGLKGGLEDGRFESLVLRGMLDE